MGSGLVEWPGAPVAGCIPVRWAGPSLPDGAYAGPLAAAFAHHPPSFFRD